MDPEIEDLPELEVLEHFGRLDLLALGYVRIPEQTSPEQARNERGEAVERQLKTDLDALPVNGECINSTTTFTNNFPEMMANYLEEEQCQAILFHHRARTIERLVVPLGRPAHFGVRMATILRELVHERHLPVLLLLLDEEDDVWTDTFEAEARGLMNRAGVRAGELTVEHSGREDLIEAIEGHTEDHDFIILRETEGADRQALMKRMLDDIELAVLLVLEEQERSDTD